jgi:prepilin-type N-terminal cleavage/methylation domain-containing protein
MKRLVRDLLHQGFTLTEVVVGVLLVTIFVAAGMQLMVASMALQTRGKSDSEASDWIQADLEQIKTQAGLFQLTRLVSAAPIPPGNTITVSWTNGFSNTVGGNRLRIGDDAQTYEITAISGNVLTISPNLATPKPAGTIVSAINYCNATSSSSGFALAFRQSLAAINPSTKPFTNQQQYTIYRGGYGGQPDPSIKNEPPFQVLELSYRVESLADNSTVAKLDTEIIPDAAFRCP